jgi:signal transduction histidine kinase/CheY-like chemotaxis protein
MIAFMAGMSFSVFFLSRAVTTSLIVMIFISVILFEFIVNKPVSTFSLPYLVSGFALSVFLTFLLSYIKKLDKKLEQQKLEQATTEEKLEQYKENIEKIINKRTNEIAMNNERLRQSEKLEAIGLLAGGIAHDFNNQLTVVQGYSELLISSLHNQPQLREFAEHIHTAGKRSSDLTKQLLAFARKGIYKSQAINLNDLVKDVHLLLSSRIRTSIKLNYFLGAVQPFVWGGLSQLHNAILNLCINAEEAMSAGGELTITTANVDIDNDFCASHTVALTNGKYIKISVTDTGAGMNPEIIKRIFEPFFTTKDSMKNIGMGLAAVYGTVKRHRGCILVQSAPNKGSTFQIYLPVTSKIPTFATILPEIPEQKKFEKNKHVLVIDDEKNITKMIEQMLISIGHQVTVAFSGEQAIEIYSKQWENIDIVIIDMLMPVLNGRETFIEMKKINPHINALISSGDTLNSDVHLALQEGVRAFLQKPYNKDELALNIDYITSNKVAAN